MEPVKSDKCVRPLFSQELKDARTGLLRAIKNLQGSLNDPSHGTITRQIVQQAIQKAQTALRMIDAAIK